MNGLIALVGSGEYLPVMEDVDRYLLESLNLSGRHARVVCLATAAGKEGEQSVNRWSNMGIQHFNKLGADVQALPIIDRASADDVQYESILENADLIYFSGGDPGYLYETLKDTCAWYAANRAWARGAIYAGCSAGAMIGWMAGLFVWFAVMWLGWDFIPQTLIYTRILRFPFALLNLWKLGVYVLAMALFGACIGFAQWKIAFRERMFPGRLWTLSSALGGAGILLGVFAVSLLAIPVMQTTSDNPSQLTIDFSIAETWLPGTLLIGFAIGMCIGLPQAFLLRRHVRGARWWLLSSIAACIVTGLLFVFVMRFLGGAFVSQVIACAVIPLAFGGMMGAVMQRYLTES